MEQRTRNAFLTNLGAFATGIIIAFLSLLIFSFKLNNVGDELWQQLGIEKARGTSSIKDSFLSGYLQYYGAKNIKNIAAGDRSVVAQNLLQYTKEYVKSPAFAQEYSSNRKQLKPVEPAPAKTEDEIRKKFIDDTKKAMANLEEGMKTANADMKKIFKEGYDLQANALKDYQDPNSEMIKMSVEGEKNQYNWRVTEYNNKLKEWENKYPENHLAFVKTRLTEVLETTKDVDFSAELVTRNNKKYFSNPAYEKKSGNWKYAFRAGKETTNTVRSFIQGWLKELP